MAEDANDRSDRLLRTANKYLISLFEHTEQPEDLLQLFVDGSCSSPQVPALRIATWAFCIASVSGGTFHPVGAGGARGLYHSTLRGDFTGAIAASKHGLYTGKKFILWTDNALVFDRIRAFVAPNAPCPKRSQNDHDMWSQLHRLARTATGKELFQTVAKVTSTNNQV